MNHLDTGLVIASVLIAALSVYVTLDLAKRVRPAEHRFAPPLLAGAAVAMGTGIWAGHFAGMLAHFVSTPLTHAHGLAAGSWLSLVVGCFISLRLAGGSPSRARAAGAVVAMTLGMCAMHYVGVAALQVMPEVAWHGSWVLASAVAALAASAAFIRILHRLRLSAARSGSARQGATALAIGLAASAAHHAGMAATPFPIDAAAHGLAGGPGIGTLILLATTGMLAMLLLVSKLDARLQRRTSRFARSLRAANARLRSANQALRRHAHSDALTGLPNRLHFEQHLTRAATRHRPHPGVGHGASPHLALLSIDLDRFRPVNDSFGHAAGDILLQAVAARLAATARHRDAVARVGGDGFLLLMEQVTDTADCQALARRLIDTLGRPYDVAGRSIEVSCSVGIALYPEHGSCDALVAHAHAAMRAAKRAGGSTSKVFDPSMAGEALEELALLNDLRRAIELGQLALHYQPKVDGRRGQIRGVEALLRWRHPQRGFVSPATFIPIAERSGLIVALGDWVIDESCRQMQAWADAGLRMRVAINLSACQLRRDDLAERIEQALRRHQVEPSHLLCEITESVAMEDIEGIERAFEGLAHVGVYLSIDDFGTGYSSLAYLRQLPAKQLKIDRSFVSDLETSGDARAIVDAVIRLAHALGLCVVAEGVETSGQRDVLLQLGCDELQGYFFARPMPADALQAWAGGSKPDGAVDFSPSVVDEALAT